MLDLVLNLFSDDGFALGYLGEALNHVTIGVPL